MSPFVFPLQSVFFSRECRWSDAARALPSRCTDRPGHPASRSPDKHTEPWGSGVRCHHQQPHTSRLHRWQGLCQDLGHQPTRQQEPSVSTRLPGNQPFDSLSRIIAEEFQIRVTSVDVSSDNRHPARAETSCAHIVVSAISLHH